MLLASFLQFVTITTLNYTSFPELTFSFVMSAPIVRSSLGFAVAIGFFGGFLPSARAAKLNIVNALRAG